MSDLILFALAVAAAGACLVAYATAEAAEAAETRARVTEYDLRIIALRCGAESLRHCGPLREQCQILMGYCWLPRNDDRARVVEALWCAVYRLAEEQDVVVRAAVRTVLHAANDRASALVRAREAVGELDRLAGMVVDAEIDERRREYLDILA